MRRGGYHYAGRAGVGLILLFFVLFFQTCMEFEYLINGETATATVTRHGIAESPRDYGRVHYDYNVHYAYQPVDDAEQRTGTFGVGSRAGFERYPVGSEIEIEYLPDGYKFGQSRPAHRSKAAWAILTVAVGIAGAGLLYMGNQKSGGARRE